MLQNKLHTLIIFFAFLGVVIACATDVPVGDHIRGASDSLAIACTDDADCDVNSFCGGAGICTPLKVDGDVCNDASECGGGVCKRRSYALPGEPPLGTYPKRCASSYYCAAEGAPCVYNYCCGGLSCVDGTSCRHPGPPVRLCTSHGDCSESEFCNNDGSCAPLKTDGEACDDAAECTGSVCKRRSYALPGEPPLGTFPKRCAATNYCAAEGAPCVYNYCCGGLICRDGAFCHHPGPGPVACVSGEDCPVGSYCNAAGECAASKTDGEVCADAAECQGGVCKRRSFALPGEVPLGTFPKRCASSNYCAAEGASCVYNYCCGGLTCRDGAFCAHSSS